MVDDDEEEVARQKKARGDTPDDSGTPADDDALDAASAPLPVASAVETADVKEMTKGVKKVELEDTHEEAPLPESVPLPEEKAGELDAEASSTASTPPAVESAPTPEQDAVAETAADVEETEETPAETPADAPASDDDPAKKARTKAKPRRVVEAAEN